MSLSSCLPCSERVSGDVQIQSQGPEKCVFAPIDRNIACVIVVCNSAIWLAQEVGDAWPPIQYHSWSLTETLKLTQSRLRTRGLGKDTGAFFPLQKALARPRSRQRPDSAVSPERCTPLTHVRPHHLEDQPYWNTSSMMIQPTTRMPNAMISSCRFMAATPSERPSVSVHDVVRRRVVVQHSVRVKPRRYLRRADPVKVHRHITFHHSGAVAVADNCTLDQRIAVC